MSQRGYSGIASAAASRLSAFRAERRGQVMLTFGIAAVPAMIMVGSAVDYSRAITTRSNLQQATDSAVLAVAHTYLAPSSTSSSLTTVTQALLTGSMNTVAPGAAGTTQVTANGVTGTVGAATLQSITLSSNNTIMCIKTTMIIPTQLMTIVGYNNMLVGTSACSQVGGTYEVAMVLDNSYSMSESLGSQTKMQALHQAATSLVSILIPSGTSQPTAAISLVPFNALVNVGSSPVPAFVDASGQSSMNWLDITAPDWVAGRAPSKFDLLSAMTPKISWGGCVEDRPNNRSRPGAPDSTNYMTTDTAATSGDSMFVPYFAPDDPGQLNGAPNNSVYGLTSENYADSYSNPGSKTSYLFLNSYIADTGYNGAGAYCSKSKTNYSKIDQSAAPYPRSGMTMACKYNGATATTGSQWFGLTYGPNSNCSTPAITPLTTDTNALTQAINAMQPTGLTNLGTGFMWGWRTISPVVKPFPVGSPATIGQQNPKPYNYGPPPNTKVIILMTDGYNTWSPILTTQAQQQQSVINPFLSSYESFGFMTDNRLANYSTSCPTGSTPNTGSGYTTDYNGFRCQMDNMLVEACQNAKAAGIIIYTVGFTISSDPIDSEGQAVLSACASAPGNFYMASNGSGIVAAFQQIAASITNLRLSQ